MFLYKEVKIHTFFCMKVKIHAFLHEKVNFFRFLTQKVMIMPLLVQEAKIHHFSRQKDQPRPGHLYLVFLYFAGRVMCFPSPTMWEWISTCSRFHLRVTKLSPLTPNILP